MMQHIFLARLLSFQHRNSKWPAGIPVPLWQFPLKWIEHGHLSLLLRQHFPVSQKDDFPVLKQWRISAAALVAGLRGNTCFSRTTLVGGGTREDTGEELLGSTAHTPAPQWGHLQELLEELEKVLSQLGQGCGLNCYRQRTGGKPKGFP